MSYPELPENHMIVDGVDICEKFKMVLSDGYTMNPPELKTYVVDIPGGNGHIDLTETLLGDVAYGNREQEFSFLIIDVDDFEKIKTEVSNFLHGKKYKYRITMDPEYTYSGRFKVSDASHSMYSIGKVGFISVTIDADPFKYKEDQVYKINGVGGFQAHIQSGRKRVKPTIETKGFCRVIFENKEFVLQQGSWKINDVLFKDGVNDIYFNSYDIKNFTWGDVLTNEVTWGEFSKKPLFEWYKTNGDGTPLIKTWGDVAELTWGDVAELTWGDMTYQSSASSNVQEIYIKYEWGDI